MRERASKKEIKKREFIITEAIKKGWELKKIKDEFSKKFKITPKNVQNYYYNIVKKESIGINNRILPNKEEIKEREAEVRKDIILNVPYQEILKKYSIKWKINVNQVRIYYDRILEKEFGIKRKKIKQASDIEVIEREIEMIEAISQGLPLKDIRIKYAEKWKVCTRQVENYYYKVLQLFTVKFEKEKEQAITKLRLKMEHLYAKCMKANDRAIGSKLLADEAKIIGAFKRDGYTEEEAMAEKVIIIKPPKLD